MLLMLLLMVMLMMMTVVVPMIAGTLVYQVETSDVELDVVTVSLDSPSLSPDEGTISLTSTNL